MTMRCMDICHIIQYVGVHLEFLQEKYNDTK